MLHIFGANHASAKYLQKLYKKDNYLYSRKSRSGFESYANFEDLVRENDLLVSLAPINFTSKILTKARERIGFLPKLCILISSTSINSKVNHKSLDYKNYLHFLEGEERIQFLSDFNQNTKFIILRTSMLWGYKQDKNINVIYKIIKRFRFFPLKENANGLRAPLHFDDLAYAIKICLDYKHKRSNTFLLMGNEKISFKKLVKAIIKNSDISGKFVFFLVIPDFILKIFLNLSQFLRLHPIINILSMINRQSEDLVFFDSKSNFLYQKNVLETNFEDQLKNIYKYK